MAANIRSLEVKNSARIVLVGSAERRGASLGWSFSARPPSEPDGPVSGYPALQ
jgi:hypothetical protein